MLYLEDISTALVEMYVRSEQATTQQRKPAKLQAECMTGLRHPVERQAPQRQNTNQPTWRRAEM